MKCSLFHCFNVMCKISNLQLRSQIQWCAYEFTKRLFIFQNKYRVTKNLLRRTLLRFYKDREAAWPHACVVFYFFVSVKAHYSLAIPESLMVRDLAFCISMAFFGFP